MGGIEPPSGEGCDGALYMLSLSCHLVLLVKDRQKARRT